jgi:hypothetical protein
VAAAVVVVVVVQPLQVLAQHRQPQRQKLL